MDALRKRRNATAEDMSEQVDLIKGQVEAMNKVEEQIEHQFIDFQNRFSRQIDKLIAVCNVKYGKSFLTTSGKQIPSAATIHSSPGGGSRKEPFLSVGQPSFGNSSTPAAAASAASAGAKAAVTNMLFGSPRKPGLKPVKVAFG
jgi:hypothetical protein